MWRPQPDIMWRNSLNERSPSYHSPQSTGQKDCKNQRGQKTARLSKSTKQGAHELMETKAARTGPTWVSTMSSVFTL